MDTKILVAETGEQARLEALKTYNVVDTSLELCFDSITRLTQQVFNAYSSVVTFVDDRRQWYKSNSRDHDLLIERPREESICQYTIADNEVLVIEDIRKTAPYKDLPPFKEATDPVIQFYAGAPLTTREGYNIGALCLVDLEPRHFSKKDKEILAGFAELVMAELELRRDRNLAISKFYSKKAREESLAITRARQFAIIENAPIGGMTVNTSGRVTLLNKLAQRMLGYESSELVGVSPGDLLEDGDRQAHEQKIKIYMDTGDAIIFDAAEEVTALRKDGSRFAMKMKITPLSVEGSDVMFFYLMEDISALKAAERIKNEFVSTVSHELRTPLTSIKGSLGLIVGRYSEDLSDKVRRMIEIAYDNSGRLVRLINDILDIEKIEAGKINYKMSEIDLIPLLDDSVDSMTGYAEDRGITLEIRNNLPEARIRGDYDYLIRVMTNLLSNAIKFSPKDATVVIATQQKNGHIQVRVSDFGPGIEEEFQERIFERFGQVDSSDRRQEAGTGLGLSICKAIVDDHGGTIGFDTKVGKGTAFYFNLPLRHQFAGDTAAPPAKSQTDTPRVLICEDNSQVARLISMFLENADVASDVAENSANALKMLEKNKYDAMTLDLQIPDEDGIAMLRKLRATDKTRNLPIMVVSGRAADYEDSKDVKDLDVICWLQKPIDQKAFLRALKIVLDKDTGRAQILHVEDDDSIIEIVSELVEDWADVIPAKTLKDAEIGICTQHIDLVILDLIMPDGSGHDLMQVIKTSRNRNVPVIIFSVEEPSEDLMQLAQASFLKSLVSNEELLQAIKDRI